MEKRFPIFDVHDLYDDKRADLPWSAIEPHREQAQKNHCQTLERLAERGGLSWCETLAVLEDRPWSWMGDAEAKRKVLYITSKMCISCGKPLILGHFAYKQDTCWECFKKEVLIMRGQINHYPSWFWDKREKHKEILNYMMAIMAEQFGEKW